MTESITQRLAWRRLLAAIVAVLASMMLLGVAVSPADATAKTDDTETGDECGIVEDEPEDDPICEEDEEEEEDDNDWCPVIDFCEDGGGGGVGDPPPPPPEPEPDWPPFPWPNDDPFPDFPTDPQPPGPCNKLGCHGPGSPGPTFDWTTFDSAN